MTTDSLKKELVEEFREWLENTDKSIPATNQDIVSYFTTALTRIEEKVREEVLQTHTPDKNIDEAIASRIGEAQRLQTKYEWGRHIGFLRENLGKPVTKEHLQTAETWFKNVFGEEDSKQQSEV